MPYNSAEKQITPVFSAPPVVGRFEKVSLKQFKCDMLSTPMLIDRFSISEIEQMYEQIRLPTRATAESAGYDFFAPFPFEFSPEVITIIPTGIRVNIASGWFLAMFPRSGLGNKYQTQFLNTTPIIDADYYNAENEGHIIVKMKTNRNIVHALSIGNRFCQSIFLPHGIAESDAPISQTRIGGMGSTGT